MRGSSRRGHVSLLFEVSDPVTDESSVVGGSIHRHNPSRTENRVRRGRAPRTTHVGNRDRASLRHAEPLSTSSRAREETRAPCLGEHRAPLVRLSVAGDVQVHQRWTSPRHSTGDRRRSRPGRTPCVAGVRSGPPQGWGIPQGFHSLARTSHVRLACRTTRAGTPRGAVRHGEGAPRSHLRRAWRRHLLRTRPPCPGRAQPYRRHSATSSAWRSTMIPSSSVKWVATQKRSWRMASRSRSPNSSIDIAPPSALSIPEIISW